ncbi:universal stress protein [Gramella sp. GC03-9]|uniref:Universal stress protein n=1 Tax=Christiangramia oceanisediminis TaxID=2920386 RepID=A0A9X2KWU0_9FLAO|nr:universal stress protein [Gramella oceanisediminis]MCP9199949.1 universal stress protein [Gramella oceanisediminis]
MEKKILVPTNFSKHAWNALIYGLAIYRKEACTFYILNAFGSANFLGDNLSILKDEENDPEKLATHGLDKLMKGLSFRKENPKHNFETIAHDGSLTEGVQEAVDTHGIDLILLGAIGDSAAVNVAYDNAISRIIDKVENCPILVVPESIQLIDEPEREIVFPTNFRSPYKLRELSALIDLSSYLNASVRVLYINVDNKKMTEEQEAQKENLAGLLSDIEFSFHNLTKTSVTTGVHLFIESRESDLLALYKRKQGFFSKLFSKAVIEEVDFNTKVPILILKEMS